MSEYTQDEFAENPSDQPAEETLPGEERPSQTEQPANASAEEPARDAGEEETQPAEETGETTTQAEEPAEAEAKAAPEATLPPEAQGEANGGPLGCCLGMMVGLLLSLSLAVLSRAYATSLGSLLQGNFWLLGLMVRILMGILAFALAIFFGYLGWRLGKRFYREYEPPPVKKRKSRARSKKLHQGA
ncbi:MAG TPA: hypothetical protein VF458_13275 [Ktedonobacteraceae bacterium]